MSWQNTYYQTELPVDASTNTIIYWLFNFLHLNHMLNPVYHWMRDAAIEPLKYFYLLSKPSGLGWSCYHYSQLLGINLQPLPDVLLKDASINSEHYILLWRAIRTHSLGVLIKIALHATYSKQTSLLTYIKSTSVSFIGICISFPMNIANWKMKTTKCYFKYFIEAY